MNFVDLPIISYKIINKLIKLAYEGKHNESMGMEKIKPIYTNDDVPWIPKEGNQENEIQN